ncbi:MAG: sarcosine oxidase subunit gamma [Acidimicrobiales bacterium]
MADSPVFESPVVKSNPVEDSALTLRDESELVKTIVRAASDSTAADQLAVEFGASRELGGVLVCGQRPQEWVLFGDGPSSAQLVETLDTADGASVIDYTHSRALFRLTGNDAPALLEKVCNLDWTDAMTPDGAVASGSVAKVTCDLVRNDVDGVRSYLVICDRSFGQYLFDALRDAGAEFGVG